ncbi:MAG: alkaline phosphatase [Bacteroidales bacterium]|nr:alkaline phosphatase [Bacteroidales bacterium]
MNKRMIFKRISIVLILLISGFALSSFTTDDKPGESPAPRVKNIILMIGDGMGITQVSAAMTIRNNSLNMTTTKHIGFTTTHSADDYITDSAASGTAMATGTKTRNNILGMSADTTSLVPITQLARDQKKMSYGVVSTSAVTHATPAAFVTQNVSRSDYEGIAMDFVRKQPDVFIGGGKANFTNRRDQRDLVKVLEQDGYEVAFTMEDLYMAKADKVAGLLADVHMPRYSEGRAYMLAESTDKAIQLLSRNKRGFFLMIEGSQIDWGGHANDAQYVLEELYDFDVAVGVALQFAAHDKNTLVIVTSDHETGGMTLDWGSMEDNSVIAKFSSTTHTGVVVPVFAFGAGAEHFTGFYDNTGLFERMKAALRLR